MNKKLIASIIAASALVGLGCDDDSDDDSCKAGYSKCAQGVLSQCVNGKIKSSSCGAGCNAQGTACNTTAQDRCISNNDCANKPATPECNLSTGVCQAKQVISDFTPTTIPAGQSKTLNDPCGDDYVSVCINGGEDMLLCWNNVVTQWSCDSCIAAGYNPEKPNEGKCVREKPKAPDDIPSSCVSGSSKGFCGSDGNGWVCGSDNTYYTTAKLTCSSEAPCVACDDGFVSCGGTCRSNTRPSDIPSSCTYKISKGLCGSDGNGWVCGSDNTYYTTAKLTCTSSSPCVACSNGFVQCGGTCKEDQSDCNASSSAACKASCKSDRSEGYYWSATEGLKTLSCAENNCTVSSSGYVSCGEATSNCTGSEVTTGGEIGQCCNSSQYETTCTGTGKEAGKVCKNGAVAYWYCNDGVSCKVNNNKAYCN